MMAPAPHHDPVVAEGAVERAVSPEASQERAGVFAVAVPEAGDDDAPVGLHRDRLGLSILAFQSERTREAFLAEPPVECAVAAVADRTEAVLLGRQVGE